jgi:hypothetical protein
MGTAKIALIVGGTVLGCVVIGLIPFSLLRPTERELQAAASRPGHNGPMPRAARAAAARAGPAAGADPGRLGSPPQRAADGTSTGAEQARNFPLRSPAA